MSDDPKWFVYTIYGTEGEVHESEWGVLNLKTSLTEALYDAHHNGIIPSRITVNRKVLQ